MACQPKGETSNRNRGFQWRLLRYPSLDPRPSPHRQPCHFLPGGGTPPTTAAPISHRQSTIFYQLPATASSTLASANFALPTCSPTTRSNLFQPLRGGHPPIRKRESRKPKTLQKCQQSNHIKPHQPGGDPDFELDSTRPPIPRLSTITYQLSSPARPSLCYR
jgi:hypothetical protein